MKPSDDHEEPKPSTVTAASDAAQSDSETSSDQARLIDVYAEAPDDYDGTCLRPLGLCELGGSCDACWYNHTRQNSIGERPDREK